VTDEQRTRFWRAVWALEEAWTLPVDSGHERTALISPARDNLRQIVDGMIEEAANRAFVYAHRNMES
jgi:hypothetical protein